MKKAKKVKVCKDHGESCDYKHEASKVESKAVIKSDSIEREVMAIQQEYFQVCARIGEIQLAKSELEKEVGFLMVRCVELKQNFTQLKKEE